MDKIIAITGASAGIGRATAIRLAGQGASVVLCARRRDRLEETAAEVERAGGHALPIVGDVTRPEDMQTLVGAALDRFGRLDVMMCNAGFGIYGTIDAIAPAQMHRLLDVNYLGTYHAIRAALPHFRSRNAGHFLVVSSIVGRRGVPYMAAYSATKFAQVGLAECLRAELVGSGIHLSVVFPISTETEFFDVMTQESGFATRAAGPRQPADAVAAAIARAIDRPVPEVYPYRTARGLALLGVLAPAFCDRLVKRWGRTPDRRGTSVITGTTGARRNRRMTGLPLARAIADSAAAEGGRALIVGGWVRDRLLQRVSKDIDIEVFGIDAGRLRELLERFGRVETVGESFQVFKLGDVDVSIPRRESKAGRGHRGFLVVGDPSLSVREAARRRDFTINAISWDPLTEEYLDPFEGRTDLANRVLRTVDPATFGDDSLRVLRALQFTARFELSVDDGTRRICRGISLDDLPAERVWGEIEKLLLLAPKPSIGLTLALDLGIVEKLFPELLALVGCVQEPEWHPEGDVWVHTLQVVDEARTRIDDLPRPEQLSIMLGAVCHDFGKPATTAFLDGRIRSIDHEEQGVAPASAFLDRLNVHTIDGYDVRRQVLGMTAQHLKPGMWFKTREEVGDGAFRRLAQKVDLELLARLAKSDCLGRRPGTFNCEAMDWFLERARRLGVEHRPPSPILLGRHLIDLGVTPGPRMGEILKAVYEQQLDGQVTTLDDAIAAARALLGPR